nr:immunoglobulin heavy chain junction region [Mus musculus]
CVRGSSGYVDW